ncbi:dTDP-4-dehydrorhamnose reductase [Leptolyngbya sp. FACHB-36]|uniref:dTDP-4-dehydrorhamnose reductase n=1 Tax=Leptolyngbya sp. FACHB-36 TaxID=2692808 RepID=UPI0016805741|nr:dTDP-4-dehydrorhamnose reductase [Leptolyngbya sp. FACHB-36]MBD2021110.1 dTDP-4-dehydrorhamnose reductase [Leptolyngbya sp. FACHB-36]
MKRILLLGVTGQVGQELQHTLAAVGDVICVGRDQVNFEQPDSIHQIIEELHPQLVINSAAYTAVDKAESEPDAAIAVNGTAPGMLAIAAEQVGAGLIHISTDYVFDGRRSSPYQEIDATNPLGAYGRSKLAGEEAIRAACPLHLILRTAWVYGARGHGNFVKTMLRLGAEREEIRVVADQIGSPTWSRHLAEAIADVAPHLSAETAGTYHYTNSGVASWYDFAVAIFEEARSLGFPLKVDRVVPITTAEYPTPASRPAFSVLSLQKTTDLLGTHPPHWRQGLRQMLVDLRSI